MGISDRLDAPPAEGWRPQSGDKLIGTIVEITEGASEYGTYPLIVVQPDDDPTPRSVHAFHTVLKNELEKLRPTEGDSIGIKYLGRQTGKGGGASYESYKVALERNTPRAADAPNIATTVSPTVEDDDEEPF